MAMEDIINFTTRLEKATANMEFSRQKFSIACMNDDVKQMDEARVEIHEWTDAVLDMIVEIEVLKQKQHDEIARKLGGDG